MAFATPDLCDEFGAEVRVAEPMFRDFGGVERFACSLLRQFTPQPQPRRRLIPARPVCAGIG